MLIHGVGMDLSMWDSLTARLIDHARVIRYDMIGHGGGPKPAGSYGLDMYVSQLQRVARELRLANFGLLGFSMGGLVARSLPRRMVREVGLTIQRHLLGQLVGYFTTEIGTLNEITHIWAFADLADRAKRRAALMTDPDWLDFPPKILVLIEEGTNKILTPVPFSPLS